MVLADIAEKDKEKIEEILLKYNVVSSTDKSSSIRLSSLACVAFNTCPLALAEAQRYIPTLITKLEPILDKYNLLKDDIVLRMTGCPNGCGRSTASEIGLIGTAYGLYNLHIGGDRNGLRLNRKFKENLDEENILRTLDELFFKYSKEKIDSETFGDFCIRANLV